MAMTDQEILTGLGEIIDEVAGVPADEVTPDKTFVDDLDIDSLSMVEIAVAAQDKFGVEIPDDQLKDLKTVQDVDRATYGTRKFPPDLGRRQRGVPACHGPGRRAAPNPRSTVRVGSSTRKSSSPVSARSRPLGADAAATWEALLAGRSGVHGPDRRLGRPSCPRRSRPGPRPTRPR